VRRIDLIEPRGDEFEPTTIPELRGGSGPVHVTLLGAPALRSVRTGALTPINAIETDDGEGGIEPVPPELFISARIMFACGSYVMKLKEYLPRLIYQCRDCQAKLAEEPSEVRPFEFEATPLNLPAFGVRLDAPAVACPACGRHNVLWSDETSAHVANAVNEALSALPKSHA
jgi:endogenous inhibitor of DNA gyrase (YacG/DUF329 family)